MDGRKKLVPFMKRMIGRCPGVVWEDKEKGMFRIPWRHFNNRDWTENGSKIFLEWAKCSGKYKDGDVLDWPVWKTQLRCALNKIPEIEPVKDRFSLEGPNPYRVYRFVSSPSSKTKEAPDSVKSDSCDLSPSASQGLAQADARTNSPAVSTLDHCTDFLDDMIMSPAHPEASVPTVVQEEESKYLSEQPQITKYYVMGNVVLNKTYDHWSEEHVQNHFDHQDNYLSPVSQHQAHVPDFEKNIPTYANLQSPSMYGYGSDNVVETESNKLSLPSDLINMEVDNMFNKSICYPEDINSIPSSFGSMSRENAVEKVNGQSDFQLVGALPFQLFTPVAAQPTQEAPVLAFQLHYGFKRHFTAREGVITEKGCRFYSKLNRDSFRNTLMNTPSMFGPDGVEEIEMPEPTPQMHDGDEVQITKLKELLDNMERGLVLMVKNKDIYAKRLCKTRVFITDRLSESHLIERQGNSNDLKKIFDFQEQFDKKIPYITLTFGQEIRKGHQEPMKKILLSMDIHHLELKSQLDQDDKMESMSSIEPLISGEDVNDKIIRLLSQVTVK